jgi:outer membrane lipoprotein carrier protein
MVADGKTLWMYDADLNQVTARQQSQVLGATPAALIATAPDLKTLQTEFTLTDAPSQNGLEWVQAIPKAKDGQLQSVRLGLRPAGKFMELAVLEILDSFGQRSVLTFSLMELNPAMPASTFEFKPPKGADVIRQ